VTLRSAEAKNTKNVKIKTQKIEEKCTPKIFIIKHIKNAKNNATKKYKKCTQKLQKITQKMPKMIYRG
jgi:hypothetical protein